MDSRVWTVILCIGIVYGGISFGKNLSTVRLVGNNQGYEPVQPISFSHRLHAGEMGIQCLYCHSGAEQSRHAGVPSLNTCLNCHRFIQNTQVGTRTEEVIAKEQKRKPKKTISKEIQKIYDAMGISYDMKKVADKKAHAVTWEKVHNLPDFVYFNHSRHINSGVSCSECHGAVESMDKVRQVEDLSMGWCMNCHRENQKMNPDHKFMKSSLDCAACHQ